MATIPTAVFREHDPHTIASLSLGSGHSWAPPRPTQPEAPVLSWAHQGLCDHHTLRTIVQWWPVGSGGGENCTLSPTPWELAWRPTGQMSHWQLPGQETHNWRPTPKNILVLPSRRWVKSSSQPDLLFFEPQFPNYILVYSILSTPELSMVKK
jgi:hypothetical protein